METDQDVISSAIAQPHAFIRAAYASACAAGYDAAWSDTVPARFLSVFSTPNSFSRVPLLTSSVLRRGTLASGSLVRYVGFVQDTADPEWFAAFSRLHDGSTHPCAFSDAVPDTATLCETNLERRLPIYLVPLPGESRWSRDAYASASMTGDGSAELVSSARGVKRGVDSASDLSMGGRASPTLLAASPSVPLVYDAETPALARVYGAGNELGAALRVGTAVEVLAILDLHGNVQDDAMEADASGDADAVDIGGMAEELARERIAREPPPDVPRLHVILARPLAPSFPILQPRVDAVTDGITPWAFRSPNDPPPVPELSAGSATDGSASPRMLAANARARSLAAARSLLDAAARAEGTAALFAHVPAAMRTANPAVAFTATRAEVVAFLAGHVGGDTAAAQWILFSLISKVVSRRGEDDPPLGRFPVTVSGFPRVEGGGSRGSGGSAGASPGGGGSEPVLPLPAGASAAVRRLHGGICALLPRASLLPLRIENLNLLHFFPRRDADSGKLFPGVLQLAEGTPVIVDETVLAEGALDERGVANLNAIQSVAGLSALPFDFGTHTANWETDTPVIVLSSGKSLIQTPHAVSLTPAASARIAEETSAPSSAALPTVASDFFNRARAYVAAVRSLSFSLRGDVVRIVEADLAGARKENPALTPEELHGWLELARFAALSFGETELSAERWMFARGLEDARKGFLQGSRVAGASPSRT